MLKKGMTVGLAALTVATGMAASATPAAARGGWGGPVAAGVIGGLAAGAILGSASRHSYGYGGYGGYGYGGYGYGNAPAPVYDVCHRERRPVYDVYGEFAGYRLIRVCD